jgi:hypothetical protein
MQDSPEMPHTLLQVFLNELSPENITKEVLLPIDNARASYVINNLKVDNYTEFMDTISAYYSHIMRHIGRISRAVDNNMLAPNALDLLKRAFRDDGKEKGAYSEAKYCTRGGLRYIFDRMTYQLKKEEREKYARMVISTAIDPLDFKAKTSLIKALMIQLDSSLPKEIKSQPPERFAANYEIIIESYIHSLEKLVETIKLL